jgi:hypothetical protein
MCGELDQKKIYLMISHSYEYSALNCRVVSWTTCISPIITHSYEHSYEHSAVEFLESMWGELDQNNSYIMMINMGGRRIP